MKLYFNILFLLLFIASCKPYQTVYTQPIPVIPLDSTLKASETIDKIITPYKLGLVEEMKEIIGFCPAYLEKSRPTSVLGSFMAEAVYTAANDIDKRVELCLLNYGGIRSTLDSGEITLGEVYKLMPFENEVTILKVTRTQLKELFEFAKEQGGEPFVNHIWKDKNAYQVMNQNVYYIATSDYLANGGDNYAIFQNALDRIDTGIKIRNALISYITNNNPLPLDYQPSTH